MANDKKSLVVVESHAKTKTINAFLGEEFTVLSSGGHVVDLPKSKLGVDVGNGFQPQYLLIRGRGKVVKQLRNAAAKAAEVILATDPDREGEAIAWHLAEILKKNNPRISRITFNEITRGAVLRALENPRPIDLNLVEAQKARRVMDRLVGYQVSPILWRTVCTGLSAGRVQSVALRLICEREEEIEAFVPQEYWLIDGTFQGRRTEPFQARLIKVANEKPAIPNEQAATTLVEDIRQQEWFVKDIRKSKVQRHPPPPFTTSTLQQDAARRFGFSTSMIMVIAQQLYEGVKLGGEGPQGLITYMRTDSVRVADEAIEAVRSFIASNYGLEYLPSEPRRFKSRAGAQEAHEAIRPTAVSRTPRSLRKYLTQEQFLLYELIWQRFVASQMAPAQLLQTAVDIVSGNDELYLFRAHGSEVLFRGFLQAYEETPREDDEQEEAPTTKVPENLSVGEKLVLLEVSPSQHFTKPPPRYTESSLVKTLDALGIGRPSTYAVIVSTILERNYVEKRDRRLVPTELGRTVNKILVANFPDIFTVKFTARMEAELDEIEAGKRPFLEVMERFYRPFQRALEAAEGKQLQIRDSLQEKTDEHCPVCGKELVIRWGRHGRFIACADYPRCRFSKSMEQEEVAVDEKCEQCGSPMVVKNSRFGRFLACSAYPKCKNARPYKIGIKCPKPGCDGDVVERRTRRGRTFYGCSRYPECDFVSWQEPVLGPCPSCGNKLLYKRYTKVKGTTLHCPECGQEFAQELATSPSTIHNE
ncbi:MAG: type I DNA topoisomerase [candidate division KSB1 bacterium]|nr:type I DNA topoisomerase [candidate division KSB1 bacterium]MDZ7385761.1 type I DNA topoisomerase [candidate division KSB1 bacterium]MDZ7391352.1 type I DNA topoisomerase [candidate division KSB1 bacterium]